MVTAEDRAKATGSSGTRRRAGSKGSKAAGADSIQSGDAMDRSMRAQARARTPSSQVVTRAASPAAPAPGTPSGGGGGGAGPGATTRSGRDQQQAQGAQSSHSTSAPPLGSSQPLKSGSTAQDDTAMSAETVPGTSDPSRSSTPLAPKPLPRIPVFPLVDSYVPDPNSTDRRHPRQLVPEDLGFPTAEMGGMIRKEDLDDRLLMATCAVMHSHQNRALCPKEVAEVMLERGWLKNAGTTPFAHVSTCIRSHIARSSSAAPPYIPLLVPFELVGALTAEEVRAVGLHAEQRPAVKRGTLWYLNPQVLGAGHGADDPFVRCRREVGLAPSDKDGLYVRGLVPLQASHPAVPPPGLRLSSTLYHSNGADEEGDEEGMGRGKRKRRASSAMMAAMSTEPSTALPNTPSASASTTPVASTPVAASPVPIAASRLASTSTPTTGLSTRRSTAFGPASAPVRSSLPRLKLRLTSLEETESDVVDSDGHTGEAAARRKKNKKKVRRAGSEGLSRSGSVEPTTMLDEDDELALSTSRSRSSTFSTVSSTALLAQSLLAASTSSLSPPSQRPSSASSTSVVSPDELSLSNAPINGSSRRSSISHPVTPALHVSMSAPNIFSHHFAAAPSPPDVMDQDSSTDTARETVNTVSAAPSPSRSDSADEEDFHEAMLRGDDFDFEWGADSYTTGSSSIVSNPGELPYQHSPQPTGLALPSLPLKHRSKSSDPHDDSIQHDDAAIDTPATTPRNPDDLDADWKEVSKSGDKALSSDDKSEDGPLGKISRVGMQATLCGAMHARGEGDDYDEVDTKRHVKREPVSTAPLASFSHETPARQRQPSFLRVTSSDLTAVPAPLPSPLALDLSPMLPMANTFAANEFDFVGQDEDDDDDFDRSSIARGSSCDHADSADDEEDVDREDEDIVTVKIEDDDSHFTNVSHPSSRASSTYPLDSFDRDLLLRATSTGASSNSSEGSDSFDPMLVVSSSLFATGLPVPQPAPSPPETTDWSMNVDFDELDGELGTHVDLLAPESIGLEELDLAWAGGEDEDGLDHPPQVPSTLSSQHASVRSSMPSVMTSGSTTGAVGSAFLTGSAKPRFTTSLPSPLTRRPSAMAELGKGLPTVAQISSGDEPEPSSPPSRRTSGRRAGAAKIEADKADSLAKPEGLETSHDKGDGEDAAEDASAEDVEVPTKPRRTTRSARTKVEVVPPSPRKSTRRSSAANGK
ncbi:hypothetical protein JCM10212_000759 [Sporobolomyces blumeae]